MAFRARKAFGTFEKQAPGLCVAGAVLNQLNQQAYWELVVIWVDHKLVDDGCRSISMMLIHEFQDCIRTAD